MYRDDWHKLYGDQTGQSARTILPFVLNAFGAGSMVEVGCGNGHWTQAGIDAGIGEFLVVDGPWNKRERLLVDGSRFVEADLSRPLALPRRFDLALCLEVAEHIRGESARILVQSLCDAADVVVFGAATPYQGGLGHINEQWPSYWRNLFGERGYRAFDLVRPRFWTDQSIHYWYRQNILVYVNEGNPAAIRNALTAQGEMDWVALDVVHPEKFEEVASYTSLSLFRLLRRLPSWTVMRLKSKLAGIG